MNENTSSEVPPEDPIPATPPPAPIPAPPPAARLVVEGVKSEREIELEGALESERARAKRAEIIAAEAQRRADELMQIPKPPAPKKEKRKPGWSDPVFDNDDE